MLWQQLFLGILKCLLTAVKLAPALAMGNTVVIKASELAPVTLLEFAKLIEKSGIPKGVVNIITGLGEPCGKALTTIIL